MERDVARNLGEALGFQERDYISHWCGGHGHVVVHQACMGTYGGNVCRCWCHQEGTDARDVGLPR